MEQALKLCCGNCANFSNVYNVSNQSMLTYLARRRSADILFPVLGETTASSVDGSHYIPLLYLPGGSLLFVQDKGGKAIIGRLINGVLAFWPLITISMLLAFIAGVIIWLMDTWFNVEEFPRSFIYGSIEGFWWAFVSMTTVGYGDRAPKSIHARIFAVIWILIGITVCSMLTASLTTTVTGVLVQGPPLFYGLKVGVLESRMYEINLGNTNNLKLSYYEDMGAMKRDLVDKKIEGILLDRYSMVFYWRTQFKDVPNAVTVDIIDDRRNNAYGILIPNTRSFEFFKEFFEVNKQTLEVVISKYLNKYMDSVKKSSGDESNAFSADSGLFYPALITSCVTVFLIIIFGIVFETRRKRKGPVNADKDGQHDEISKLLEKVRDGMMAEVEDLLQKWDKRLRDISVENKSNPVSQVVEVTRL